MKYYLLLTARQWDELQKPQEENSIFRRSPLVPSRIVDYTQLKPVRYNYSGQMDEIIQYCVTYQDECKNLYSTLETLGLYYGTNTYNKDDKRFTEALKEALKSQRAILIEIPIEYSSGLLPPENNFLKLPSNPIPRRLTASEVQARQLARYDNEENYIELTVYNLANQPFTIFDNASQKMLKQGTLDSGGYAYVSLPVNAQYVDIVFDKQQTDRPWYYDVPLQLLGGLRDAGQSVSDLAWDMSPIKQTIEHDFHVEMKNPAQFEKVPEAETVSGALAHGVSQFLVGFIPAAKGLKIIKPLTRMGKLAQSMIAGGVADFAVFAPHEERLSNLIQSFDELQNPVTAYLQASPDDSSAEGRLKNTLEGLLLGALIEPFAHSLRALKYARIKWMVPDVKTQVHYKLEMVTIETESGSKGNWNKALNNPEPNSIYLVDGNKRYHTDELGRLKQVEAELKLDTLDRNTYQQLKMGKQGIEGDEGGHLIASILNGSGEKINMLPMNANLNRGAWKQMENTWAKALQEGKTVKVKIEPVYNSSGIRPDKFKVKYSIDNGRSIEKILINAPGGI
ncbi:DNA/RNA non-specific endonuclease [Orbus hercynius]|uniref:DNA/RNA non-specific endonuclease n=1 Tax=Orbus hercynius TaxID=593135 RepID=A0A495REF6_9GAMM|nr:DNA/RNA non-specific endonuclease [Orbus hercynius]RKS85745.1 DNA/RNA non-specific endonuclease [Orbus hercynius]